MTDAELKAIEERLAKITPGEWKRVERFIEVDEEAAIHCYLMENRPGGGENNCDFIAHAPADIRALLTEVAFLCRLLSDRVQEDDVMELARREGEKQRKGERQRWFDATRELEELILMSAEVHRFSTRLTENAHRKSIEAGFDDE